jgi:hypothetical protein
VGPVSGGSWSMTIRWYRHGAEGSLTAASIITESLALAHASSRLVAHPD